MEETKDDHVELSGDERVSQALVVEILEVREVDWPLAVSGVYFTFTFLVTNMRALGEL